MPRFRIRHLYPIQLTYYVRMVCDFDNLSLTDSIRDWGFIMRPYNDLPEF